MSLVITILATKRRDEFAALQARLLVHLQLHFEFVILVGKNALCFQAIHLLLANFSLVKARKLWRTALVLMIIFLTHCRIKLLTLLIFGRQLVKINIICETETVIEMCILNQHLPVRLLEGMAFLLGVHHVR